MPVTTVIKESTHWSSEHYWTQWGKETGGLNYTDPLGHVTQPSFLSSFFHVVSVVVINDTGVNQSILLSDLQTCLLLVLFDQPTLHGDAYICKTQQWCGFWKVCASCQHFWLFGPPAHLSWIISLLLAMGTWIWSSHTSGKLELPLISFVQHNE